MLVMLNTLMDISEAESGTMQLRARAGGARRRRRARGRSLRDVADAKGVALAAGRAAGRSSCVGAIARGSSRWRRT